MQPIVIAALVVLAAGATWFIVRFVREYRNAKRYLDDIRARGRVKSETRRLKREIARKKKR
jgi:hypothetical protein